MKPPPCLLCHVALSLHIARHDNLAANMRSATGANAQHMASVRACAHTLVTRVARATARDARVTHCRENQHHTQPQNHRSHLQMPKNTAPCPLGILTRTLARMPVQQGGRNLLQAWARHLVLLVARLLLQLGASRLPSPGGRHLLWRGPSHVGRWTLGPRTTGLCASIAARWSRGRQRRRSGLPGLPQRQPQHSLVADLANGVGRHTTTFW